MKFQKSLGVACACASIFSTTVQAGLVVGGDFENPAIASPTFETDVTPFGWTGTGDIVYQGYAGAVHSGDGNQWFDLNPGLDFGTGISQDIALEAGVQYKFSFVYNGGGGGTTSQISFDLDSGAGSSSLFFGAVITSGDVYGGDAWSEYSTTFMPMSSDIYTLSFAPNGAASGGFIDAVDITSVPVPAAAWLFGSGLLGLIGISRRKKAA